MIDVEGALHGMHGALCARAGAAAQGDGMVGRTGWNALNPFAMDS